MSCMTHCHMPIYEPQQLAALLPSFTSLASPCAMSCPSFADLWGYNCLASASFVWLIHLGSFSLCCYHPQKSAAQLCGCTVTLPLPLPYDFKFQLVLLPSTAIVCAVSLLLLLLYHQYHRLVSLPTTATNAQLLWFN